MTTPKFVVGDLIAFLGHICVVQTARDDDVIRGSDRTVYGVRVLCEVPFADFSETARVVFAPGSETTIGPVNTFSAYKIKSVSLLDVCKARKLFDELAQHFVSEQ